MKKTVTVSIPVYNGEQFIIEALESVVNQTVKVDQIILCDNMSVDHTIELIEKFITEHESFDIKLYKNQSNIGFQGNFIKCYSLAKTDYLVILHADDLLKPDAIEKQIDFLKRNPKFAIVAGKADSINAIGTLTTSHGKTNNILFNRGEIFEFIKETASYLPFSAVMYHLQYSNDIAYLSEDSVGPEELYWPLILQKHPIAILGESLINNRSYEGQMHISNSAKMFDKYVKYFENKIGKAELEKTPYRIEKTRELIEKQVSMISIKIGQEIFQYNKDFRIASKYYLYGIQKNNGVIFSRFFLKSILKAIHIYK